VLGQTEPSADFCLHLLNILPLCVPDRSSDRPSVSLSTIYYL
jgi:hypothetical protein